MRNTITLLLLLSFMNVSAQTDLRTTLQTLPFQLRNLKDPATKKTPAVGLPIVDTVHKNIRLRCGMSRPVGNPLLILDGTIVEYSRLSSIDVYTISDITILNGISGSALFGLEGAGGAIIIITETRLPEAIRIQAQNDKSFISGATVSFISSDRRDTLMYVADSAGQVSRKDLKKGKSYDILVTATGYKDFTSSVSTVRNGVIELERDFITGPEVIVTSGIVFQCGRRCVGHFQQVAQECGVQTKLINDQRSEILSEKLTNNFTVYPNPVQRGQQVSLKLLAGYFPSGSIRVLTMDGKQVLSVTVNGSQKQGLIQVSMQQSWTSGVYIFQLVYANGRPGASEKVILQ